MGVIFTDNVTANLLNILKLQLPKAKEIKFGVAFIKYSGLSLIEDEINQCLNNNGNVEFLLGLDFRTTEPKALRILHEKAKEKSNLNLFCFSDPSTTDTPFYHPKIYIISRVKNVFISIGSSNLTAGGLKNNVEINAVIEANIRDEIVSDVYGLYNRLKFQKGLFKPDLRYIEDYEKTYNSVSRRNIIALKEKRIKNKIKELKEREKTLPSPRLRNLFAKLTSSELHNYFWSRYNRLLANKGRRPVFLPGSITALTGR